MPRLDGYATAALLRGRLRVSCPIVGVTANSYSADVARYVDAGVDAFVPK